MGPTLFNTLFYCNNDVMRKTAALLMITAVILLSIPVFASDVDAKTFPLSSEIYGLMDDLYALQGLARPSTSRPWSQAEAQLIFSRISASGLSPAQQKAYERISEILDRGLRWNFSDYGAGAYIDLALEAYLHSNGNDFATDADWIRGFESRRPLAKLSMDFSVGDLFYTYCDLQYGYGRVTKFDTFIRLNPDHSAGAILSADGYIASYKMDSGAHILSRSDLYSRKFATNILPKSEWFDFIWPKRAVASAGGKNWNLQLGRDRLEIGNSALGNLLVDNHSDFNDYMSLSFFGSGFRYQWTNIFLNGISGNGETRTDDTRIFMIHTLEFRPAKSLSLVISEDVMFKIASDGGVQQVVDFSFFNPAFIWHNLNNRSMFNAIAYAEANWTPLKGLEVYGQFALDQGRAPNENPDQSDAWGLVAGTRYTLPAGPGIADLHAEFAYTTPLLYRRDQVDFVKMTRYFHLTSASQLQPDSTFDSFASNALVFEYIGFPYGGDVEALEISGTYRIPGILTATLWGRLIQQGEFGLYTSHSVSGNNEDWPNYTGRTPSGTNWTRSILLSSNVEFDMQSFFNWPGVTLEAQLDWIGKWNYAADTKAYGEGKTDTQFSIGLNVRI